MSSPEGRETRERLDLLVQQRGLAPSREKARALIMAGRVQVDGKRIDKPGTPIRPSAAITVEQPSCRYVGRGGLKLENGLRAFGLNVDGLLALDIGASTGGFTHCLLEHGAREVIALDVGRGLLDWTLRHDPRVRVMEGMNARQLVPSDLAHQVDIVVCDVSFISLKHILPAIAQVMTADASAIVLVKPQFELGRGEIGRGVVRDPEKHALAVRTVAAYVRACHLAVRDVTSSGVLGAKGNREFFLWLARTGDIGDALDDRIRAVADVAG